MVVMNRLAKRQTEPWSRGRAAATNVCPHRTPKFTRKSPPSRPVGVAVENVAAVAPVGQTN